MRAHEFITEKTNTDVTITKTRDGIYYATLDGERVGRAIVYDHSDDKVGENERYIWKSAVKTSMTRKGIATALYNKIADDLAAQGLKLVPSPDTQLSDEGFAFWKSRDPESIKNHGTFKAEPYKKYIGREVIVKDRPAVIERVGWSGDKPTVGIRYTDVPEGSTNSKSTQRFDVVKDQLE